MPAREAVRLAVSILLGLVCAAAAAALAALGVAILNYGRDDRQLFGLTLLGLAVVLVLLGVRRLGVATRSLNRR